MTSAELLQTSCTLDTLWHLVVCCRRPCSLEWLASASTTAEGRTASATAGPPSSSPASTARSKATFPSTSTRFVSTSPFFDYSMYIPVPDPGLSWRGGGCYIFIGGGLLGSLGVMPYPPRKKGVPCTPLTNFENIGTKWWVLWLF